MLHDIDLTWCYWYCVAARRKANGLGECFYVQELDRLRDKKERYTSNQEFLSRCLENDIVPIGLQLELEPTIGNHNDEFLNKWHTKLKEFSMNLMKDVIEFCIDTDTETSNEINKIALKLKERTEIQQFKKIEETIVNNNEIRRHNFKQKKTEILRT